MSEKTAERTRDGSDEGLRDRTTDRLDSITGMDRPGRTNDKTDRVMRNGKYALIALAVSMVIGFLPVGGLIGLVGAVAFLAFLVFAVLFAYPLVKAMLS
jgi:hypothetical protein